ncbi:hypothetical protein EV196_106126 [Mariniflexile fucanivorans]|uniref:VCBS repeat protein n=1 Tax=Mariniflexile fucanivorans TaxID=264023 RepID=A0A4V2QDM1_9FLAO|nr:hypothetical protein [Mariniflexile fucanivorans]TCL64937.1 hypothetical protein EV196_106126 [Mariniflexile fucanivorans]
MKYLSLFSCLLILLVFSCNEVKPKSEKEVRTFVKQWNNAHTLIKSTYLDRYYFDVVNYYEKDFTRDEVQQDKNLLFQQFPDYTQRIYNNQLDVTKVEGNFLVTFIKQVTYSGIKADYPSYLSLTIKNGKFKILREGLSKNAKNQEAPIFPSTRESNVTLSKNRQLYGDFNGDGLSDYAKVIAPVIQSVIDTNTKNSDTITCQGGCNSVILFSNKDLKPITIKGAYQSQLENLKDLNSDGADEIGFWDIKATTKSLYVFNATNGTLLTEPIVINTAVHKNLKLIDVFKKTGVNKITVTSSEQVDGKWVLKSKVIVLK